MRMTPLEIQSHRFARCMRGYDRDEVDAFLQMVTEDYEALVMEVTEQLERNRRLEEQVEASKEQESLLRETLINAQAMSDRMRDVTEKECRALLSRAESEAEKVTQSLHCEAARLNENIRDLRGLRTRIAETLRTAIRTQMSLVEHFASDLPELTAKDLEGFEPESQAAPLQPEPHPPGPTLPSPPSPPPTAQENVAS